MRRKTRAEGHKETNKVTQTRDEGRRRAKALAERADELGGGGTSWERAAEREPRRNTEGRVKNHRGIQTEGEKGMKQKRKTERKGEQYKKGPKEEEKADEGR